MARGKRYSPDLILHLMQQIEAAFAGGMARQAACEEFGICEATYLRWRKKYGGVAVDLADRLRELERENANLRRLVAQLSLEKLLLKDLASGNL